MGVRAQQFVRHAREPVLTLNNLKGMQYINTVYQFGLFFLEEAIL